MYHMVMIVLLLNLLIAMMSQSYSDIQANADLGGRRKKAGKEEGRRKKRGGRGKQNTDRGKKSEGR